MDRYSSNKKLLNILTNIVKHNPDLRFSQILDVYNFVERIVPDHPETEILWANDFYLEPVDLLERVNARNRF